MNMSLRGGGFPPKQSPVKWGGLREEHPRNDMLLRKFIMIGQNGFGVANVGIKISGNASEDSAEAADKNKESHPCSRSNRNEPAK